MKTTFQIVSAILISLLIFACSPKKEETKPLIVAMELQFPPFEMSDEAGNPTGISVKIAEGLAKYLDRPLKIQNTSWTGLIPSLQTGKADVVLSSMTITEERSQVVDFSLPYAHSGLTLLLNKNTAANTFLDLDAPEITVAVKSGTIGAILAQEKLPQANIRYFDDVAACVLEVSQGKADAFIYYAITIYENHKKHSETTRVNLQAIIGTDKHWGMAVKKGNEELLKQINAYILTSQEQGDFDRIAREYLGEMANLFDQNNIPFFFDMD